VAALPDGRNLAVLTLGSSRARLFQLPLDGSPEREIVLEGGAEVGEVYSGGAVHADGRILLGLSSADSWFTSMGVIDLATGRITRKVDDPHNDFDSMCWTPEGKIIALKLTLRSSIWKFTPDAR
jgi:hypothetical protein